MGLKSWLRKMRRVGKAAGAERVGGVPTINPYQEQRWWARREGAFAHPTVLSRHGKIIVPDYMTGIHPA
jgi:hypothetical protein